MNEATIYGITGRCKKGTARKGERRDFIIPLSKVRISIKGRDFLEVKVAFECPVCKLFHVVTIYEE